MAAKCDTTALAGARDKAMILLAFACALRVSELAKLNAEDIALSDDRIALTLRNAKTAEASQVQHVVAACSPDLVLCPVESVRCWLNFAVIEAGPAFRGLTKHGTIRTAAISVRALGDIIKTRARAAGVVGWADVSSHSLRRGWATAAATAGVPAAIIKDHGRWKTSASAERYIDEVGSASAMAATRAVVREMSFGESMAWAKTKHA